MLEDSTLGGQRKAVLKKGKENPYDVHTPIPTPTHTYILYKATSVPVLLRIQDCPLKAPCRLAFGLEGMYAATMKQ